MLLAAAGALGANAGHTTSRKVGSQSEVPVLTGHNKFQAYRNPSRKVGSQSEVPVLTLKGGVVNVRGYQSYSIARSGKLTFVRKPHKFKAIEALLTTLHKEHGFESLLDVGCNAGLVSLIARNAGFREVLGLDHDREYVDVFNRVATARNATSGLRASVFSFGSPMPTTADVVFCGAILHWVYCLTANFAKEGFGGILRYLLQYATEYLIVEWIDPSDAGVQGFDHIRKCGIKGLEQQYTVGNFERAIAQHATIESKHTLDGRSRVLYVMRPGGNLSTRVLERNWLARRRQLSRQAGCDARAWAMEEQLAKTGQNCWAGGPVTHRGTCDQATKKLRLPRHMCPTDSIELTFGGGETRGGPAPATQLEPLAKTGLSATAVTSAVWVDAAQRVVVKQVSAMRSAKVVEREACFLDKLQRVAWAPRLLCSNRDTLVMQHVGDRVSHRTLPADHGHQMRQILRDMQSLGVRHNDIATPYRTDVMVRAGRLSLVDWGFASINRSFSCNRSDIPSEMPCFRPKPDRAVLHALQRMAGESKVA